MNPQIDLACVRKLAPLLLVLISALIAVAAYLQALNFPFISDDGVYITDNTKLAGLHFSELWRLFTEPYNRYEFLPLRDLSYWFDLTLFGLNPAAFRLHNILLYLLCLPLVYATTLGLWRYLRPADNATNEINPGARWAAATVTALFALHPAHVEAVIWISGRKDVLSGLFSLLALCLAVYARREQGLSARYAGAALLALAAAMLSKATAVAVAPVIALLWCMFWRDMSKKPRRRSQLGWPVAVLVLAIGVIVIFSAHSTVKVPFYLGVEIATRAMAILGWMGRLSISPENRHFIYPVLEDGHLPIMVGAGGFILAAAIVGTIMILRKPNPYEVALITFLLLCSPYLQLIPYLTNSLVSDRFLYLAVWPIMLIIVLLVWRLKSKLRVFIFFIVACAWSFQTFERPRDWRSEETLTDVELRAYPGNYYPAFQKIWIQLGEELYNAALTTAKSITLPEFKNIMLAMIQASHAVNTATNSPDEALAELQNFSVTLNYLPAQSKWNIPMLHVRDGGKYILSLKGARLAKQFPENASVRYQAGLWKLDAGNYKDAVTHLRAAIESPNLPESMRGSTYKNLGLALLKDGQAAEAEIPLRAAIEQTPPELSAYCSLVEVYKQEGQFKETERARTHCPDGINNSLGP